MIDNKLCPTLLREAAVRADGHFPFTPASCLVDGVSRCFDLGAIVGLATTARAARIPEVQLFDYCSKRYCLENYQD